jgi:hypothetical protein
MVTETSSSAELLWGQGKQNTSSSDVHNYTLKSVTVLWKYDVRCSGRTKDVSE